MHRLILVEGLPGDGKSTLSKKIASYLREWRETNPNNEEEACLDGPRNRVYRVVPVRESACGDA